MPAAPTSAGGTLKILNNHYRVSAAVNMVPDNSLITGQTDEIDGALAQVPKYSTDTGNGDGNNGFTGALKITGSTLSVGTTNNIGTEAATYSGVPNEIATGTYTWAWRDPFAQERLTPTATSARFPNGLGGGDW